MKYWVDPPEGWRYGFPKVFDPLEWNSLKEFLKENNYPYMNLIKYTRMWEYTNK